MNTTNNVVMPGGQAEVLLKNISTWQNTTTIILHGGSVFEFKGVFPKGKMAQGFYNLIADNGFEGHLNLNKVKTISFQSKHHRGKESHAFVFQNDKQECIFKIFLGRDKHGELYASQKSEYLALKEQYKTGAQL